jgi:type IV secretion system protein VirB9
MKHVPFRLWGVFCAWGFMACAMHAQEAQTFTAPDPRLVSFEFDQDQSYLILTRPKSVTLIQMAVNESVITAVAGDTVNFSVVVSLSRNYVMVRPKYEGLVTSLTLMTSERSYPLTLRSTKEGVGKWYQRVRWTYPLEIEEEAWVRRGNASLATREVATPAPANSPMETPGLLQKHTPLSPPSTLINLAQLNTSYTITGEAPFRPLVVFDDGVRTYLKMPLGAQSLPALFASDRGAMQLVNYTLIEQHIVVQGLHPGFVLKLADTEVKVSPSSKPSLGFWERFKP